jgi:hypothetical protein
VAIALLIAPGVNYMVRTFGFRVPLIIGTSTAWGDRKQANEQVWFVSY